MPSWRWTLAPIRTHALANAAGGQGGSSTQPPRCLSSLADQATAVGRAGYCATGGCQTASSQTWAAPDATGPAHVCGTPVHLVCTRVYIVGASPRGGGSVFSSS